ncbi:uncharacterized protein LOC129969296 [Argiope bruennichi]|uniref:Uncharacterized protein n=1 Tax=Argiope bruennichi TaxID=94029 RepID=A0A8T0FNL0_ARGBR|nr:uncharacterized protein LOC129969296 [Argiope bruennichi]KAF8791778.1 hypothetical protein HNY73_003461 [Argiope bruennichi]
MERGTTFSEAGSTEYCNDSGISGDFFGAEDKPRKRRNTLLSETIPAMHPSRSEIKTCTSGIENENVLPDELEFEIEKARLEIFNHFMNLKIQMDNNEKVMAKEIEIWTRAGLANISGEKNPQNEFLIKSLIHHFGEIIENIGKESKRDVSYIMDDIRKILIKLLKKIEMSFRPKPSTDAVRATRRGTQSFLWIGLWSVIVTLIAVFPDYLLRAFESAVAFYQSTILIVLLFCILHFSKPVCK